jgi:Delta14-sterol reductase
MLFMFRWDALYMEKAILTTMDITTDGFGFMLAFGGKAIILQSNILLLIYYSPDLVWVPFTYCLQARYLVDYDPSLNLYQIIGVVIIHFFGYYIFR